MEQDYKIGDTIMLPDDKRDLYSNKIGGLNVEILNIEKKWLATVKIILTGTTTKIIL